ncbi:MAG: hypothetical protein HJJLKODD_01730 [Phycisphaerae bacterium]|nr:hypothetical protein [Phycisphaerae bacterium]
MNSIVPSQLIYSELAQADSEFKAIVEIFVNGLPDRLAAIEQALSRCDLQTLRYYAHQLKGSGGGHGYPDITRVAAELESQVVSGAVEQLRDCVDELTQVIQRVRVTPTEQI